MPKLAVSRVLGSVVVAAFVLPSAFGCSSSDGGPPAPLSGAGHTSSAVDGAIRDGFVHAASMRSGMTAESTARLRSWSAKLDHDAICAGLEMARGDDALMMPGFPGAGKSTLCASLVLQEKWRLLSDELAVLDPATGAMQAHPRPISLKNASIDIVSTFPGCRLGTVYRDTRKGDITHAACPPASIAAADATARVRWVVFPRFEAGAAPLCEELSRAEAFALISEQSFNNERMGETGFTALCALLTGARCFELVYGSTDDGLALVHQACGA